MRALLGNGIAVLLGLLVAPLARADFPAAVPLDPGGASRDPVHAYTFHLEVSQDGAHVYLLEETYEGGDTLSVLARNATTGELGLATGSGMDVSSSGHSLTMAPDGRHLYVGDSGGDFYFSPLLQIVARDPVTGGLSPGPAMPATTGYASTKDLVVSPDNEHVYVADDTSPGKLRVFDRDPLTGALTPVEVQANGVGGVDGLSDPRAVVVSPDGAHVYALSYDTIAVFARNASSGALSFVQVVREGVGGVSGLQDPRQIAVTPDGAHVLVLSNYPETLAVFGRNAGTGMLTFVEMQEDGVGGVTGLDFPTDLIASADGAHVYVASDAGVVIFARNAGTGALTFVALVEGGGTAAEVLGFGPGDDQVYVGGRSGVAHFDRDAGTGLLDSVEADVRGSAARLAISPDGQNIYVSGRPVASSGSVTVFARDTADGSVDYVESQVDGAGAVQSLAGASDIAVSSDGAHVYATALDDDTITVFERAVPAGTLTLVESQQDGVAGVDGLDGARALALSPDGAHVYVGGEDDAAVAVFARNSSTGALTFVEVHRNGVVGVDGLSAVFYMAVSPDGGHLYVMSRYPDDAIAIFARNPVSGALTFLMAVRNGVGGMSGLSVLSSMALSADGLNVYVSEGGFDSYGITVLARNPSTGLLSFVETLAQGTGEIYAGSAPVAVAPDGTHVYSGAGVVFSRDAGTGALRFVGASGVSDGFYSFFSSAVGVSPDGRDVYFSGGGGPTIASQGTLGYSTRAFSGCGPAPLTGCHAAGRGRIRIMTTGGGQLVWSWTKGQATDLSELGDPRNGRTHYALCVYEGPGTPSMAARALAPAGGSCRRQPYNADSRCWRSTATGFKYRDDFNSPEGIYTMLLKSGTEGRPSAKVRAFGDKLQLPTLPLTLPVRVQLQAANGECWETTHSIANSNDGGRFIAPAD